MIAVVWGLAAVSLAAQTQVTGTAAGLVLNVRTQSDAGTAVGFAGGVGFRRFGLDVRYAEGKLQPKDSPSESRDLVEGAVAVKFAATPWLSLHLGPQIRSYTPSGSDPERWLTWQLGGRGEAAIVGSIVRGHAMLWHGLGLDVSLGAGSGSTRGGEVGVTIDLAPRPFWFGLAYGIDHAQVRGAGPRETVEALTFTVGVQRR